MCRDIEYLHSGCGHEHVVIRKYCSAARLPDPDLDLGPRERLPCEDLKTDYADVISPYHCSPCYDRLVEEGERIERERYEWEQGEQEQGDEEHNEQEHDKGVRSEDHW